MVTDATKRFYDERGYVVVEGLFNQDEVARYREHYMTLRRHGSYPGDSAGVDVTSVDPLRLTPA